MKQKADLLTKSIISVFMTLIVGFSGSMLTDVSPEGWYANLNKPSFTPPDYVFPVVWSSLYILMGISFALIWKSDHKNKTQA